MRRRSNAIHINRGSPKTSEEAKQQDRNGLLS
jgi:hypothetical protein